MILDIIRLKAQLKHWLRDQLKLSRAKCFVVQTNMDLHIYSQTLTGICSDVARTFNADANIDSIIDRFSLAEDAIRYAEKEHGLIVGSLSREQIFSRTYHKYNSGLCDILPFGELYHNEIMQLSMLTMQEPVFRDIPASMVEWVDKEDSRTNIVIAEERPNTSRVWFRYTLPQKEAISKLNQFEKLTRHKTLVRPVFPARTSEFIQ